MSFSASHFKGVTLFKSRRPFLNLHCPCQGMYNIARYVIYSIANSIDEYKISIAFQRD